MSGGIGIPNETQEQMLFRERQQLAPEYHAAAQAFGQDMSRAGQLGGGYEKGLKQLGRARIAGVQRSNLDIAIQDALMRNQNKMAGASVASNMYAGAAGIGAQQAAGQFGAQQLQYQGQLGQAQKQQQSIDQTFTNLSSAALFYAGFKGGAGGGSNTSTAPSTYGQQYRPYNSEYFRNQPMSQYT